MSKRQFFLGMLLAAIIGGVVALAGESFLIKPKNAGNFDEKQQASFVNLLSGDDFTSPERIKFVVSAQGVTPPIVHVKSQVSYPSWSERDPVQEYCASREP